MKTAMQELKDVIDEMIKNGGTEEDLFAVIAHIDNWAFEKEKEQMVDFAFFAYQGVSQLSEVPKNLIAESKRIFEANFNRIYNQNK